MRDKRSVSMCVGCHCTDFKKEMLKIPDRGYIHRTCFDIAISKLRDSFKAIAI